MTKLDMRASKSHRFAPRHKEPFIHILQNKVNMDSFQAVLGVLDMKGHVLIITKYGDEMKLLCNILLLYHALKV
jgi:hypothetical protein